MNAEATNTTVTAKETLGEKTQGYFTFYLVDQDGNKLTDQSGNYLVASSLGGAIILRGSSTDTNVRANG